MRYIDWWLTLTLTIPQVQFFYYLVTSGSDLPVRTIRCCSVVFSVTSSLAVIHTIRGRQWMCIARDRAWWVSRCTQSRTTVTVYSVSRLVVQYPHAVNGKLVPKCKIQTRVQQLLIAKPNIRCRIDLSTFEAPVRGFPSDYCHNIWYGKTRMVWLPDVENISKISLFVLTECTNMTDGRTLHDGKGRTLCIGRQKC